MDVSCLIGAVTTPRAVFLSSRSRKLVEMFKFQSSWLLLSRNLFSFFVSYVFCVCLCLCLCHAM